MKYYPFPAILHCSYDDSRTYGKATLTGAETAIEFTGDFIPLFPLGSPACIEWVLGNRVLERLEGEVYLSSPKFMRLVDVDKAAIRRLQELFASNVRFSAQVEVSGNRPGTPGCMYPVDVLYISSGVISLLCAFDFKENQTLLMCAEVKFLTLDRQPLVVRRRVQLRRGEVLLLCEVQPSTDDNTISLSAYASRLEQI